MAEARSDETFVALCLLTVTGASLLTQKLGFSDTMGAFVAGVLLAETNYSTQARSCSLLRAISITYFVQECIELAVNSHGLSDVFFVFLAGGSGHQAVQRDAAGALLCDDGRQHGREPAAA